MKKRYLFSAIAAILLMFLCGTHVYAESNWISPSGGHERMLQGNQCLITYKPPVYNNNFKKNTCTIEVKDPDGKIVLHEDNDYFSLSERIITYFQLDKIGTYTISAQCGWNNTVSRTESATVEVYAIKDISGATVSVKDQVYDPYDQPEPAVTVKLDGKILTLDKDYVIEERGDSAGTAKVIVSGIGDYTGEASGTYKIIPLDLTKRAKVSAADQYQDYAGEVMKPNVVVEADNCPSLLEGIDYEVIGYSNNTKPGTASVKVRFIGNYTGTGEAAYEVIRKYDLYVGSVQVTTKNAANITGEHISGKVSYDAASSTLSLSNASISDCYSIRHGYAGTETYSIYGGNLTIRLSGRNSMGYCIKADALKITGNGSLSLDGSSGLPTSTALTCRSLLVSKDSTFSIAKANSPYGNCAAEIDGKLDVQGTMSASVSAGAPATGIKCGTADISGKLNITVKSAYTNFASGLRGNVTISGEAVIDTSGTKNDTGIIGSSLTVKDSGSLTVLSRKIAASVSKLVLGNGLVLHTGGSKDSAFETTPSAKELGEHAYLKISAGKPKTSSVPKAGTTPIPKAGTTPVPKVGTTLKDSRSSQIYVVSKEGKEVSLKGDSAKKKTIKVPQTVSLDGIKYKVTAISANAFKGNKTLQKITIGTGIKKIGKNAFSGAKKLKTVIIKSKKLKSVGSNAIKGINKKAIIKVPKAKLKKYKKLFSKKTGFKKTMKLKK